MEIISSKKKIFKCVNCKKEWNDFISNDKNKRFCSIKCKSDYSRINRICKNCGNIFSICKSVLKTNATGNYCCRKCYIDKITTGLTKNKDGFRFLKNKLFPQKQFCAICGTFKRIHIHHIEPYRYTKNNNKNNLIPLCIAHHKVVEIQTEKLLELGNKEMTFMLIKNILRDRQQHTTYFIKSCLSTI